MSLFIQNAKREGRNESWMYVLGVVISFIVGQIIGAIPLLIIAIKKGVYSQTAIMDNTALGVSKNTLVVLMMLPFIISMIILLLFIKYVHKKRVVSIISAYNKPRWNKFFFSFFLWLIMSGLFDFVGYLLSPSNYEFHFSGSSFIVLCFIAILIVPIQTSYEEFLFRGYLMQGIGMWKGYTWIPFVITSLVFGLLHIANPEIAEYGYITIFQYIGIGILLGVLTTQSDGMELALGLHAANNIYGCLFMSFKGSALQTDSLFYTKTMDVNVQSYLMLVIIMVLFYFIVARKFNLLPLRTLFKKFIP